MFVSVHTSCVPPLCLLLSSVSTCDILVHAVVKECAVVSERLKFVHICDTSVNQMLLALQMSC